MRTKLLLKEPMTFASPAAPGRSQAPDRERPRLLSGLVGLAIIIGLLSPAPSAAGTCVFTQAGVIECSGDFSSGLDLANDLPAGNFTTLDVVDLTAPLGGISTTPNPTPNSNATLIFKIDTLNTITGADAQITDPIDLEFLYNSFGAPEPVLNYNILATEISTQSGTSLNLRGLGPDNLGNSDRQIGYGLNVGIGAPKTGGTLTFDGDLNFSTSGGAGTSPLSNYEAGPAGKVVVTVNTNIVGTATGTQVSPSLTLTSVGGNMESAATTTTAGPGGPVTLQTNPGTSIDITSTGPDPSILLQSTGGSPAFMAQGGGGAGGDGGDISVGNSSNPSAGASISVTQNATTNGSGLVATSVGAASENATGGRTGGRGGAIDIVGVLDITTKGAATSPAVVAASLGGQGGSAGGNGGAGGAVTVNVLDGSLLSTSGTLSSGLVGQSVGGRGGNAPDVKGVVAFAADGGAGGQPGAINLTNDGTIMTSGGGSFGILGHSIGGGGGAGGNAFGVFFSEAGNGGTGGNGQAVTIINSGDIMTGGHSATGIEAQSIAGSGGSGGISKNDEPNVVALFLRNVSIGGGGGNGGTGGKVEVTHTGTINTSTKESADLATVAADASDQTCPTGCSRGILAQSIGGGGGNGGSSQGTFAIGGRGAGGGAGGEVDINLGVTTANAPRASITTGLDHSDGVTAQSIGGGGGNGGGATSEGLFLSTSIGGSGSSGGTSMLVDVEMNNTDITTGGDRSHGINAQSIGGGGGNGGFAVSSAQGIGVAVSVATGGSGANGGTAETVALRGSGNTVTTNGIDSHGIIAQSIGGGGGNGGMAIADSATLAIPDVGGAAISTAVGGTGGGGGVALPVYINTGTDVTTHGERSKGILAQSIGGGGGSGGLALAASGTVSVGASVDAPISVSTGGSGGQGGAALVKNTNANAPINPDTGKPYENLVVTSLGTVTTTGDAATGIVAQALGGAGGTGGASISGAIDLSGPDSTSVTVPISVGGTGGAAGEVLGEVSVSSNGTVSTSGINADGIVIQSIGGSGGNGGSAISGSLSASVGANTSVNVDIAVGGPGGKGGFAGAVSVTNTGAFAEAKTITTGAMSDAIVAQSIGGHGGNGGTAASGSLNAKFGEESTSNQVNVSIGGKAAAGGTGNSVNVETKASPVTASGDGAKGIVAQSIGGDGGNGGMAVTGTLKAAEGSSNALSVGIGGGGGSGGSSSDVHVQTFSAVSTGTTGAFTTDVIAAQQGGTAILAQSIGGSGGNGGLSASAAVDPNDPEKSNSGDRSLSVDIGGGGGVGGKSGDVLVQASDGISTLGHLSDAIVAQSIGGSGGVGGGTINYADANKKTKSLSVSVGGKGGSANITNTATVELLSSNGTGGAVEAKGAGSRGVVVQSIGGSGGTGGSNHYSVKDDNAPGDALSVGIGGKGGDSSAGQTAQFSMEAGTSVKTGSGLASAPEEGLSFSGHAVVVQSIGGNGGIGGAGITGNVKTGDDDGLGDDDTGNLNVGIGGPGATGGAGGAAFVFNGPPTNSTPIEGTIKTENWNSHGILAQSIGGGGGDGGTGINGTVSNGAKNGLNVGIGAVGAGGGTGGVVTVKTDADISALGDGSKAVFAQSVGGGGGNGGIGIKGDVSGGAGSESKQLTFGLGRSGGNGGGSSIVTVSNGGTISTATDAVSDTAREMDGIFAQSISGGGGNGGIGINGNVTAEDESGGMALTLGLAGTGGTASSSGEVFVDNSGDISFAGQGSRGIFAQSIAGGGGNAGAGIKGDLSSSPDQQGSEDSRIHLDIGIGASGGAAGTAQKVTVTNEGTIEINAKSALAANTVAGAGILAQSVGGGGGNAGIGINGSISGSENTKAANVGIGGKGGSGGAGGVASVQHSGTITVFGDATTGITAQSIGGGGGTGALGVTGTVATGSADGGDGDDDGSAITFGLGQAGGAGGAGNEVNVTVAKGASITTGSSAGTLNRENSDAFGVFAQSVGGGGGAGMLTGGLIYGNVNDQDTAKGIDVTSGATANGGDGGTVEVIQSGTLTTYYNASHGVLAQSVGGGGGHVGSLGGIGTDDGNLTWGASVVVGGGGKADSAAGKGGEVLAVLPEASASTTTNGHGAHGIFAQSVGGGGGTAANAAGQGSTPTEGNTAYSTKNAVVGITLGGKTGSTGDGGNVIVAGTDIPEEISRTPGLGSVSTAGDYALGIVAQSIGGGGGEAGVGLSAAKGSLVTLGGASGSSGNGNDILINYAGTVTTSGDAALGILAQSVGGGGGYGGGFSFDPETGIWGSGKSLNMAQSGDQTGDGDDVTATLGPGGSVSTEGDSAVGIFAQSVGGGGGLQGNAVDGESTTSIGGAGGKGASGLVQVSVLDATVTTEGRFAHGVFAQSVGSDGGNGQGVNITVGCQSQTNCTAKVKTTGAEAAAVVAQSLPTSTANLFLKVDQGAVVESGLGPNGEVEQSGPAVWFIDGSIDKAANVIDNSGTIKSGAGAGAAAVKYSGSGGGVTFKNGTDPALPVSAVGADTSKARATVVGNFIDEGEITDKDQSLTEIVNFADGVIATSGLSTFDLLTNYGRIDIETDDKIGTKRFAGDIAHEDGGVIALDFQLFGEGQPKHDLLLVGGELGLMSGSLIVIESLGRKNPEPGSMFDLVIAETFSFDRNSSTITDFVDISSLTGGIWDIDLNPLNSNFVAALDNNATQTGERLTLTFVAPVPLPEAAWLYGSGLMILAGVLRSPGTRRRNAREGICGRISLTLCPTIVTQLSARAVYSTNVRRRGLATRLRRSRDWLGRRPAWKGDVCCRSHSKPTTARGEFLSLGRKLGLSLPLAALHLCLVNAV